MLYIGRRPLRIKGMKVSLLVGSFWILSSSFSMGAPNTPLTVTDNHRWSIRQRFRLSPDELTIPRSSFTLGPEMPPPDAIITIMYNRSENPQRAVKPQEQSDFTEEPSPYLKPAIFIGGALAITAVMIRTDQQTYNIIHEWRTTSDPLEDVSPAITNLGDGRASMVIFGGLLAYSYVENDRTAFQAGRVGLESFLLSGIVAQILKHTFGRQRPMTSTESGGRWNGAYFLLNEGSGKRGGYAQYDAFPSGHTATIFAAATTLAEVFKDTPWVPYASYTVASSVAISRIMESDHWLSDCFVGGLIGYFSTQVVLHYNHSAKPVALLPTYDGHNLGLALNVGF
jgi:membrane-associated phospholipid phosphatase